MKPVYAVSVMKVVVGAATRLADMEDRSGQLNVTKVAGTLLHVFVAGGAVKVAIDGPHARITKAICSRVLLRFVLS